VLRLDSALPRGIFGVAMAREYPYTDGFTKRPSIFGEAITPQGLAQANFRIVFCRKVKAKSGRIASLFNSV
jgi:hypothetical protein